MNKKYSILLVLLFFFLGCSTQMVGIKQSDVYFSKALNYFEEEKYSKAKDYFENIVNQYSGTEIAIDALYYLAFCKYELKDFEESRQSFKVYTRYSQDIIKIQSANFMICLCMFELTLDYPQDQSDTYNALEEFQLFIEEYPNSKYTIEATEKIQLLREKLAFKKYNIAKLYIKSGKFNSAKIYINDILNEYYDTESADDARIGHIIILLMNDNKTEANNYLAKNKNSFNLDSKYLEAENIISNSDKKLKIKKIYFKDYINKIL